MKHTIITITGFGVLLSLLWLSACGPSAPTSTPTLDLNPFRTEVAATVLAQVSQTLAHTPPSTPAPSRTATISLTSTLSSTRTQAAGISPSPNATLAGGTPVAGAIDLAEWVSQSIPDGTIFAPGETFTITFQLKNAGTSTWTTSYLLRFYSGEPFGAPQEIPLSRVVLPNETVDISIPMKAPVREADYRSDWVLANESRSNFKEPVFLKITVAAPSTPTASPAPTTTP